MHPRVFTAAAIAETCSFLLLLAAVAVKYGAGRPAGVEVMGPLHGLAFVAYFAAVVALSDQRDLGVRRTLLLLAAAVIPLGGVLAERRIVRPLLDAT